ncbi:unnamed protein product, partial [Effrenium voratum]
MDDCSREVPVLATDSSRPRPRRAPVPCRARIVWLALACVAACPGATRSFLNAFRNSAVDASARRPRWKQAGLAGGALSKRRLGCRSLPCTEGISTPRRLVARHAREFIPTAEAAFLTPPAQPLTLSPDGTRTARFEFGEPGIMIRVEAAFGKGASNVSEGITIIPRSKLGVMGVRDLFWLDNGSFLITGYEGPSGRFYAWVVDLGKGRASLVNLPSKEASLFVPLGLSGVPILRLDDQGSPEVLLGFIAEGVLQWNWYTRAGDLIDAAIDDELPTSLWREVLLSKLGLIDAVLLLNGTVCRRSPDGWLNLGALQLAAESSDEVFGAVAAQPVLLQEYLVALDPDFGVLAVDVVGEGSAPQFFPGAEELGQDLPEGELGAWVLRQSQDRETAGLLRLAENAAPAPVFAHPFADVRASGAWVNPKTEEVEAITVDDLVPRTYSLCPQHEDLMASASSNLPKKIRLNGVELSSDGMVLLSLNQHGERWVAYFAHPLLCEPVALPAEPGAAGFGREALLLRGTALSAESAKLRPRLEAQRLQSDAGDLPVYLAMPREGASALVVRLHDGPDQRDRQGADSLDAWLLSRGYGVLKVNFRGSAGFGRRWRSSPGFAGDVEHAVAWARDAHQLGPVAVLGSYFGAYAALHTASRLNAACVAVAPLRPGKEAPEAFAPSEAAKPPPTDLELSHPLLVVEYERDDADALQPWAAKLAPPGCETKDWPTTASYVQYAGERRGGGVVRQNMLDLYRRVDSFLHSHLGKLGAEDLLKEDFVDEVPFLSGSLQPASSSLVSTFAEGIELSLERALRESRGDQVADRLPVLHSAHGAPAGTGFAGERKLKAAGKRQDLLPAPASRMTVREDGTMEVTVSFAQPPKELFVLLSEVWIHLRAKSTALTLALPRQPKPGQRIEAFRLPDGLGFHFEIAGEPAVGALENYNFWASKGGGWALLDVVLPEELEEA